MRPHPEGPPVPPTPRVRFAPAPSGWLHVGSVRTALFNWLHARGNDGVAIFRIEDTDASRATAASMDAMHDAMAWLGLDWDEGVRAGGAYGPYRQSERKDLHRAVARRLEETGVLYRDERTAEELEAWRNERRAADLPPIVKRSTTPPPAGDDRTATLRLQLPDEGTTTISDLVRGDVTWDWAHESDPVLVRSNGDVTYPLANSVDDVAQGVTLVCRGEDLLSVTPRQVFLYDLLTRDGLIDDALAEVGLPAREPDWTVPSGFAHLSMIVGMDRKKLSKRHGSVSIQEFARKGFLPETIVNYLALLGWGPEDGRERLDRDELVAAFSFDRVSRSAAAFDTDKLTAFNGERIRDLDGTELAHRLVPYLDGTYPPSNETTEDDAPDGEGGPVADWEPLVSTPPTDEELAILRGLVPLVQERMQRLDEVQRYAPAFFVDELALDQASVDKVLGKPGAADVLRAAHRELADLDAWTTEAIEGALRPLSEELGIGFGKVAQPVRVAVTGSQVSPPLFESVELMPRGRVLARIEAAIPVAEAAGSGD
ncbi:MAG: glutamate--tRNA ligase [Actinobacteria bacterium]|nr:glutamate--tRNA ligase [Actinomycetota bacterium]